MGDGTGSTTFIAEWYDGLVQGITSDAGRFFYAFCVRAGFGGDQSGRSYWICPISSQERDWLVEAFRAQKIVEINAFFQSGLLARMGALAAGEPESWRESTVACQVAGNTYAAFIVYPSVHVLAAR